MLDEAVGDTDTLHAGCIAMLHHKLYDGGTQSADHGAVLYGDDARVATADLMQQLLVDGLEVDHIVMRGGDAFLGGGFYGLTRYIADGADRDDGYVCSLAQSTATTNG